MSASIFSTFLSNLSWREPLWLLLALVPITQAWIQRWMQKSRPDYADPHLMPWASVQHGIDFKHRLLSKNSAFIAAWVLLGIAAAGPRTALELVTPEQPSKLDIMLVVDVSRSMQASDINPSRIRRAQIELDELINRAPGNRIGIIVFAARPHLLTPLTSDMSALRFYLHTLDEIILPTAGSNPYAAIALAEQELADSSNPTAILMLSDGDFITSETPTRSTSNKPPLYILGLGTAEGAAIPLANGKWLEHEGRAIITRLNENALRALIDQQIDRSQNYFRTASDDGSHWRHIYDNGFAQLQSKPKNTDTPNKIIWRQHYHWPLSLAVLLLWLSLTPYRLQISHKKSIPGKRKRRTTSEDPAKQPALQTTLTSTIKTSVVTSSILLLILYSAQQYAFANPATQSKSFTTANETQAYKYFVDKQFVDAINAYKQLSGFTARFGEAACHYRLEDYPQAIRQFSQAVLAAETDRQRAKAIFNLGNSYFQNGNYAEAISTYQDVLKYSPEDQRTKYNLDFSIALKKAVDERLRRRQLARKMGKGVQLNAAADSININPKGIVTIDDAEPENKSALPELSDAANQAWEKLIDNGLEQIQLAASGNDTTSKTGYRHNPLSIINARIRMSELEDQSVLLWKRQFEMEEGFPAPLTEPRELPGTRTW